MLWLRCGDELIEICGVVLTPPARQFLPLYNHEMGKHECDCCTTPAHVCIYPVVQSLIYRSVQPFHEYLRRLKLFPGLPWVSFPSLALLPVCSKSPLSLARFVGVGSSLLQSYPVRGVTSVSVPLCIGVSSSSSRFRFCAVLGVSIRRRSRLSCNLLLTSSVISICCTTYVDSVVVVLAALGRRAISSSAGRTSFFSFEPGMLSLTFFVDVSEASSAFEASRLSRLFAAFSFAVLVCGCELGSSETRTLEHTFLVARPSLSS